MRPLYPDGLALARAPRARLRAGARPVLVASPGGVAMTSYRIEGPATINFSGGRTSGYMLRQILDAHGGTLPPDVRAIFANTGKEDPATLDFVRECGERWNVPITWLEYQPDAPGWREVTHATASRDGEPYAAANARKQMLPNWRIRFCTQMLKILPVHAYVREVLGWTEWTSVIGLRFDEPRRWASLDEQYTPEETKIGPLITARVTKPQVLAWWAAQSFDLQLDPHGGNCDLCFLKGRATRLYLIRQKPERAAWWIEQERVHESWFVKPKRERGGYAAALDLVQRSPFLPGLDIDAPTESLTCACTD